MIYIYSYPEGQTSNHIIDWLNKYKVCYKQANSDEFYLIYDLNLFSMDTNNEDTACQNCFSLHIYKVGCHHKKIENKFNNNK